MDIFDGLQKFELKLAIGWSWANQGISLVDHFHLGAYKLIELDIYAMLPGIRCLNGLIAK
jgi:hypothetical protein